MMDHANGLALMNRHVKRIDDDLLSKVVRHRPADDAATKCVENDGKIKKTRPRGNIRYIGHPQAIDPLRMKVAIDEIGSGSAFFIASRRYDKPTSAMRSNKPVFVHEPPYATARNEKAKLSNFRMKTWTPVRFIGMMVQAEKHADKLVVGD